MAGGARPFLFEIGWEVCNQLGGIHTVLRTRVRNMLADWGDNYLLVGPYLGEKSDVEFASDGPEGDFAARLAGVLEERGVICRWGRWLVPGNPPVLLLDASAGLKRRIGREIRKFWNGIADEGVGRERDPLAEAVLSFGFLVKEMLVAACTLRREDEPVIAHMHEWMGGAALPLLAGERPGCPATVFTTHGTLLGRYICAAGRDFYGEIGAIEPQREAAAMGIRKRYALERLAASSADVFSTVSEVSAREAEHLLGRRPDVILPNGLDIERFSAVQEFQSLHRSFKFRIHHFVAGHFFGNYVFDLDRTLYFFIAGRYEYRNKGMDVFLESLAALNRRLREEGSDVTVVGFIITDAPVRNINVDVLSRHAMFGELMHGCDQVVDRMGERLRSRIVRGEVPDASAVFTREDAFLLKRAILARRNSGPPGVVTHDMPRADADPVLRKIAECGLLNHPEDRVKVIFHPQFLSRTNPLLGLDYHEFVRGCNLGVFPSYYEPWGYTPMECVASGIPAVTTDLSGFGSYVRSAVPEHDNYGLWVLPRSRMNDSVCVSEISGIMLEFCRMNRRQRVSMRNRVELLSEYFSWDSMIAPYRECYEMVLRKVIGRGR